MEIEKMKIVTYENEDIMKLFLCNYCQDVVRLFQEEERSCKCGKSKGRYLDEKNAEFKGDQCFPIGFHNHDLGNSLIKATLENKHQTEPTTCRGVQFKAFVILDCSTSIKIDR